MYLGRLVQSGRDVLSDIRDHPWENIWTVTVTIADRNTIPHIHEMTLHAFLDDNVFTKLSSEQTHTVLGQIECIAYAAHRIAYAANCDMATYKYYM